MSLLLPTIPPMPGSQWLELVVHTSLTRPERWGDQRPTNWDGTGFTGRSLAEALQRHDRLVKFAVGLTPEQRDVIWSDPSAEAAELRRVMR